MQTNAEALTEYQIRERLGYRRPADPNVRGSGRTSEMLAKLIVAVQSGPVHLVGVDKAHAELLKSTALMMASEAAAMVFPWRIHTWSAARLPRGLKDAFFDHSIASPEPKAADQSAVDDDLREELACVLTAVASDGLPGPRDLDVAIDAILEAFKSHGRGSRREEF